MITLQDQLEIFRENFPSTKCFVLDDGIVYRTADGKAWDDSQRANKIIKRLNLELIAIPTFLSAKDSFFVKSKISSQQ